MAGLSDYSLVFGDNHFVSDYNPNLSDNNLDRCH